MDATANEASAGANALLEAWYAEKAAEASASGSSSSAPSAKAASASQPVSAPQDPLHALRDELRAVQAQLEKTEKLVERLQECRDGLNDETVYLPFPPPEPAAASSSAPKAPKAAQPPPVAFFAGRVAREGKVTLPPDPIAAAALSDQSLSSARTFPSYAAALSELSRRKQALQSQREVIRKRVLSAAGEAVQERLGVAVPGADEEEAHHQINEKGELLDEEGNPIVDLVTPPPDTYAGSKAAVKRAPAIAPFRRQRVDYSIFDAIEAEVASGQIEGSELDGSIPPGDADIEDTGMKPRDGAAAEAPTSAPPLPSSPIPSVTPLPHSADRPQPARPALKKTASTPTTPTAPRPAFGATAFKRGFLNLNPSSPAAEHSSDYVERGFVEATAQMALDSDGASSARKAVAPSMKRMAEEDRLSRSQELPPLDEKGKAKGKGKKSVRIQSPERDHPEQPEPAPASHANEDEGVEDEARRIVELLGPGVVSTDLPGMNVGEAATRRKREVAQRSTTSETAASAHPSRPPVSQLVVERTPARAQPADPADAVKAAKSSAFARGFLNKPRQPKPNASQADPRVSLGMSALDRATRADEPLEREREAQGLTPAVPHARPSKAFAEKLKQRQASQDAGASSDAGNEPVGKPAGSSAVRFGGQSIIGDDEQDSKAGRSAGVRFGNVSVGEAVTTRSGPQAEDEDDAMQVDDDHDDHPDEDDEDEEGGFAFDSDDDDESSYNSEDLADLQPDFDSDLDWDADMLMADLQRECARAKASLLTNRHEHAQSLEARNRQTVPEGEEIVPIDHVDTDKEAGVSVTSSSGAPKPSRFKQDRMARAFGAVTHSQARKAQQAPRQQRAADPESEADEAGHELAHLLQNAQNLGPEGKLPDGADIDMQAPASALANGSAAAGRPVMVIPQLAPVRFAPGGAPITEESLRSEKGVELEGESDEEDARLTEIAKRRLGLGADEGDREGTDDAPAVSAAAPDRPPVVRATGPSAQAQQAQAPSSSQPAEPPKKVSRFKAARMAGAS